MSSASVLLVAKCESVQRTGSGAEMPLREMQIDRRLFQVAVPEQHLNGAQVGAGFQQMSGKAMAKGILVLLMICIPQRSVIHVIPSTGLRWKLFDICEGRSRRFSLSDFRQEHRSHYRSGC